MSGSHPVIARPRLHARATSVLDARVTLLVAPPGSGKSVLLEQWIGDLGALAGVVRLDLAFEHNDAERFQAALFGAARSEMPTLHDGSGGIEPTVLDDFAAAVARRRRPDLPIVFVLDRFERIVDPIIPTTMLAALGVLGDQVRVLISSRTLPGMMLTQFRASGALQQLGMGELSLTRSELRALAAAHGADDHAAVDRLGRFTLGWPVAASLLLRERQAGAAVLAEYFEDEVLAGLSRGERALAEEVAVLDLITIEQVERVIGPEAAATIAELASLRGIHLPLLPADPSDGLHYPPVFKQYLLAGLERRDPARRRHLAQRARRLAGEGAELSRREIEVLQLLGRGRTAQQVAGDLSISFHTAKTHIRSIYVKLGVSTRVLALQRARELGVVTDAHEEPVS